MTDPDRDRDRVARDAGRDVVDVSWSDSILTGLLHVEFEPVAGVTTAVVVVAAAGEDPVAVVSTDLPVPAHGMQMRGPGIWLELICEEPLDHWTVGLEAFGVTVDDGEEISVDTRGDLTPIGLDLDLDTVEPGPVEVGDGLSVPLRVHGEVLLGSERYDIDCSGRRSRGELPAAGLQEIRDRICLPQR